MIEFKKDLEEYLSALSTKKRDWLLHLANDEESDDEVFAVGASFMFFTDSDGKGLVPMDEHEDLAARLFGHFPGRVWRDFRVALMAST